MHEGKNGGMEVGIQNIKKKIYFVFFCSKGKKWFLNFIGFIAIVFSFFTNTLFFTN